MKTLFVAVLTLLAFLRVQAQVSMELSLEQDQFLPNETIRVAVKIINRSGQQLHLGAEQSWLTFNVESADGNVVVKNGEVPVVEPFDLESSQMATKRVDIQPYFQLGRIGRFKLTASMHIKEWALTVNSVPVQFDVVTGGELWSQDFGVATGGNTPPESRKYKLIKANFLREQLRLYVQVSSGDGAQIFKVEPMGPLVSFSSPQALVDRTSQLHVLWQTGAQSYSYAVIDPDGAFVKRDIYDSFNSRPRLTINDQAEVIILGGVRRAKSGELPFAPVPETPLTNSAAATNR